MSRAIFITYETMWIECLSFIFTDILDGLIQCLEEESYGLRRLTRAFHRCDPYEFSKQRMVDMQAKGYVVPNTSVGGVKESMFFSKEMIPVLVHLDGNSH